jgi:dual specificity phosphatase 12
MSHTSTSALYIEDESETESNTFSANPSSKVTKEDISIDAAHTSGLQLSDAVIPTVVDDKAQLDPQSKGGDDAVEGASPIEPPTTHFISPSDLSSQLFANPTLAALRSANSPLSPSSVNSPPILLNAKCSGYFVEPVRPQDQPPLICPILIFYFR